MPRREKASCSINGGPMRDYFVTFTDDPPDRAEAVAFFNRCKHDLFPANPLPADLELMPLDEAQRFLDANPIPQKWDGCTISEVDDVLDADLHRLTLIPELNYLKIYSNKISDAGISHLACLHRIEFVFIYSDLVTDNCLQYLTKLKTLRFLDMQGATNVSRDAYNRVASQLPNLVDLYPPPKPDSAA